MLHLIVVYSLIVIIALLVVLLLWPKTPEKPKHQSPPVEDETMFFPAVMQPKVPGRKK